LPKTPTQIVNTHTFFPPIHPLHSNNFTDKAAFLSQYTVSSPIHLSRLQIKDFHAMNTQLQIVTFIALTIIGYFAYPSVAKHLTDRNLLQSNDGWTMPVDTETDEVAKRYPYPDILSLEEIMGDWMAIPTQYLPSEITVTDNTSLAVDGTDEIRSLRKGTRLAPIEQLPDGNLKARLGQETDDDSVTGTVAIDATNTKHLLTRRYHEGVANMIAQIHDTRENERRRLSTMDKLSNQQLQELTGSAPPGTEAEKQAYIEIAKQNVNNGGLTGVTSDMITDWRWIGYEEFADTGYWAVAAIYPQKTHFGTFDAQAVAYIRDGRVAHWKSY